MGPNAWCKRDSRQRLYSGPGTAYCVVQQDLVSCPSTTLTFQVALGHHSSTMLSHMAVARLITCFGGDGSTPRANDAPLAIVKKAPNSSNNKASRKDTQEMDRPLLLHPRQLLQSWEKSIERAPREAIMAVTGVRARSQTSRRVALVPLPSWWRGSLSIDDASRPVLRRLSSQTLGLEYSKRPATKEYVVRCVRGVSRIVSEQSCISEISG